MIERIKAHGLNVERQIQFEKNSSCSKTKFTQPNGLRLYASFAYTPFEFNVVI
jgi:hypothetical protein